MCASILESLAMEIFYRLTSVSGLRCTVGSDLIQLQVGFTHAICSGVVFTGSGCILLISIGLRNSTVAFKEKSTGSN